ncbi:hypothetical protein CC86DRAFT_161523 [Ophiobolus disseminans]|uniref:Protein kinase domain-containing protein n=1 Tax=Ophiobolus disseminans TaxID=1469910 RepID=A0A6A7AB33_9PLEO|nr:hypothetical protein CC86DRAFT_161523 [Ophiobolus disseminans]
MIISLLAARYTDMVNIILLLERRFGSNFSCDYTRGHQRLMTPTIPTQGRGSRGNTKLYSLRDRVDESKLSRAATAKSRISQPIPVAQFSELPLYGPRTHKQGNACDIIISLQSIPGYKEVQAQFKIYCAQAIAGGETSVMYSARGEFSWISTKQQKGKGMQAGNVAIKRLKPSTSMTDFLRENRSLSRTAVPGHANLVQQVLAYVIEDPGGKSQIFHFVFPPALGSLRQLLSGSLQHSYSNQVEDLWGESEGLASAVEYLHNHCRVAHMDARPSNVLIFIDRDLSRMKAKIADFGIAIDMDGVASNTRSTRSHDSTAPGSTTRIT